MKEIVIPACEPKPSVFINPNNPLARHSGEGRNPARKILRKADRTLMLSHFRGKFLINWIPAFAGMTQFCANELFGIKSICCNNKQTQTGFTYIVVLLAIAIMGATLALTGTVWHTEVTREKEAELLFIGGEFRHAIKQYYQAGGQYPKRLEDLLKDPRQPATVRYLRKIYTDPITGKKDWGFVRGPDNSITAVYSPSDGTPLKTAGFALADKDFEGKTKYSEWQFVALPKQ